MNNEAELNEIEPEVERATSNINDVNNKNKVVKQMVEETTKWVNYCNILFYFTLHSIPVQIPNFLVQKMH